MSVIGVIAAFQEGGRIATAVTSLYDAGCDSVFVLDGAWLDRRGVPFGAGSRFSTDETLDEARGAGATVEAWSGGPDAAKQTELVRRCGATIGDFVVRIDADETLRGTLGQPSGDSLVWLHNHGDNDLPGVRSTWPHGDDANFPIPLLRCLEWRPALVCVTPGRWRTDTGWLEPYHVGALRQQVDARRLSYDHPVSKRYRDLRDSEHERDPADTAAFPILAGVWIDHYRDTSKADAKRAYYEAVA